MANNILTVKIEITEEEKQKIVKQCVDILKENMVDELEKIKTEIKEFCKGYLCTPQPEAIADDINEHIINKRIAELKGKSNE